MKNPVPSLAVHLLATAAASSASAATIINDDFTSNTIGISNRLRVENSTDAWIKDASSLWGVSTGVASNSGIAAGVSSEGGLLRVIDVAAASLTNHTKLTFSFNYTVGTGSTLYFYAFGLYDGTLTGTAQLHNTGATVGVIQSQYDGAPLANQADYTGISLKDGSVSPTGNIGDAYSFAAGSSGTFSQTIDISSYSGIDHINDLQYLTLGFASKVTDYTGAGAITLDDVKIVAIPEPTSIAQLLAGLCILTQLRRRA